MDWYGFDIVVYDLILFEIVEKWGQFIFENCPRILDIGHIKRTFRQKNILCVKRKYLCVWCDRFMG
jgi:hypothetical protein